MKPHKTKEHTGSVPSWKFNIPISAGLNTCPKDSKITNKEGREESVQRTQQVARAER